MTFKQNVSLISSSVIFVASIFFILLFTSNATFEYVYNIYDQVNCLLLLMIMVSSLTGKTYFFIPSFFLNLKDPSLYDGLIYCCHFVECFVCFCFARCSAARAILSLYNYTCSYTCGNPPASRIVSIGMHLCVLLWKRCIY